MRKPTTDREILKVIHDHYYKTFISYGISDESRESKIYVPIDCEYLANKLRVDQDIVFGRLYYHLDKKYGYQQPNGSQVHLFAMRVGKDQHAVHFPLLSAVLAEQNYNWFQFYAPLLISIFALTISFFGAL
ncbi:hypothetical protein Q3O60_10150 [Alkalimonas collagenimarina]|uniref:Uncharacterized protein n=1 Tax=Alkalimonas collagenimarina TaxID=400390 RepID=A0ABT9GZR2_9GAMM|nr:hypothetical protein [Alkalimonas collagenimarina]MDP4536549.1 hypothetical protein [Alkalimonas collagenimarina]